MRCSFEGEIGAGSAPERSTSSSLRESSSWTWGSAAPMVMSAWPPGMRVWMTGALSTRLSRMMAKRRLMFAPVMRSKMLPPCAVNVSATCQPPSAAADWSGCAAASRIMSPVISAWLLSR